MKIDFSEKEYRALLLGAFLHDIGKLINRYTSDAETKEHPYCSADFVNQYGKTFGYFVDTETLAELVQKHHENSYMPQDLQVSSIANDNVRLLAGMIKKADLLSSSERGQESVPRYFKNVPLWSVLERLTIEETEEKQKTIDSNLEKAFRPAILPATESKTFQNLIFPVARDKNADYEINRLIETWGQNIRAFMQHPFGQSDFDSFIEHLNTLVYSCAWCLPSDTQSSIPDISLYDHLKTTAAIAACLYQYHKTENLMSEKAIETAGNRNRFLLVAGDISGIQKYIFDIPSNDTKGVARKLRARSFFVQLCNEIAVHKILHALDLPSWNLIMNSGGNFYLLLPNLQSGIAYLENLQKEADQWFIEYCHGELTLNIAWMPFDDSGFKPASGNMITGGFVSIINSVKEELALKKQHKLVSVVQTKGRWLPEKFLLPAVSAGETICQECKKYPAQAGGSGICTKCETEKNLGKKLPHSEYIFFYADAKSGQLPVLGYSVSISESPETAQKPYLVIRMNNPDISNLLAHPASFRYVANHIPAKEGEVLTFSEIADKSIGDNLLGFLKIDADNMGKFLAFGLKRATESLDSISRSATLSRMLDTFFSGWIEHILTAEFGDCYTVFSGGDDLFITGPWNQIIELAERIEKGFSEFSGNAELTLSAGIFIARPNYPVALAQAKAEEALEQSKKSGRDRITLLGRTLTWSEWENIKKEWVELRKCLAETTGIPSAFAYQLLNFSLMWQAYKQGRILGLRYHPLLIYQINRNLNRQKHLSLSLWLEKLLKWPPQGIEKVLDNLDLITQLSILYRRGGSR